MRSQDILSNVGTQAFIVTDPANIRYLTGIDSVDAKVLIRPRTFTLFVYALEEEAAIKQARRGVTVRSMVDVSKALERVHACGFESDNVSLADFMQWKRKFKNTKFVRCSGVVEGLRRKKSPQERSYIKHALLITEELLARIPIALKKFPTEKELAWSMHSWAHDLGADGFAFDPIVAFGLHTSRPHHRPTDRRLHTGDLVQIDIGARYRGYCADRSEVYFTGKPSRLERRVYDAVSEAKDAAMAAVKPGMTTLQLDRIARKILRRHGFEKYFCHGLGHGVGLEIHEGVSISSKGPDVPLLKNEVITIEPGVYIPGKFGMRLEEMVFV